MDGVPWIDAAAMEYQVQEDCAGVATEARQPMDQNSTPESGFVDGSSVAEGLWLLHLKKWHGDMGREVQKG